MKALLIEHYSSATDLFINSLHQATGLRVEHAETLEEGTLRILQHHGEVCIAFFTIEKGHPESAIRFPVQIRQAAASALIQHPYLIAITPEGFPLSLASKCWDLQVDCILGEATKQISERVKAILWKMRTSKGRPTIRIEYRCGSYCFFLCGATEAKQLPLTPQIAKLLLFLAQGKQFYGVEELAARLGVTLPSVKKYMLDLRRAFDSVAEQLFVVVSGADVFRMERGPGGTLCKFGASIVWG